jgi:hypothetical protein
MPSQWISSMCENPRPNEDGQCLLQGKTKLALSEGEVRVLGGGFDLSIDMVPSLQVLGIPGSIGDGYLEGEPCVLENL